MKVSADLPGELGEDPRDSIRARPRLTYVAEDTTFGEFQVLKAKLGVTHTTCTEGEETIALVTTSDSFAYGKGRTIAQAYNEAFAVLVDKISRKLLPAL